MHNYGTRVANNYRPHFCRIDIKQFTILYQGPKIWNSLPGSIINSSSYLNFKKNMLGFLKKKKLSYYVAQALREIVYINDRHMKRALLKAQWFLGVIVISILFFLLLMTLFLLWIVFVMLLIVWQTFIHSFIQFIHSFIHSRDISRLT